MKKWLSLLLFSVLVLVLAACTANKDDDSTATDDASDTEEANTSDEKVLYLNNEVEPTSFDPSIGFDSYSWDPLNNLMEGLVRLDENNEPKEAIAEKIDVSDDNKTYTFTLREDAKWSNGDQVTAGDFVYGWLHMLNPDTASPAAFLAYPIVGAEAYNTGEGKEDGVGIKAVDDKTFEVTLTDPTEAFLNIISNPSFFPVNEKVATDNAKQVAEADTFVANGPFKLA